MFLTKKNYYHKKIQAKENIGRCFLYAGAIKYSIKNKQYNSNIISKYISRSFIITACSYVQ